LLIPVVPFRVMFGCILRIRLFKYKSSNSLYDIFVLRHVALLIKVDEDILISEVRRESTE
jgi:hypothetical protein